MTDAARSLWYRGRFAVARRLRRRIRGGFQPYGYTLPERYPWLFQFARDALSDVAAPRLLSFGCSTGDELISLRRAFPNATTRGLDVLPSAITACRARLRGDHRISIAVAADTRGEADESYDAVFCLAVLCHGDLTAVHSQRSDRLFPFARFERAVADLARCVRPGGFLFLHTVNYRFSDTSTAAQFDTVLKAHEEYLAADLLYGRDNRLMAGARYTPVGFRKRIA